MVYGTEVVGWRQKGKDVAGWDAGGAVVGSLRLGGTWWEVGTAVVVLERGGGGKDVSLR